MKTLARLVLVSSVASIIVACGNSENIVAEVGDKKVSKQSFDAYLDFKRVDKKNEKLAKYHLTQFLEREALTTAIEASNLLDQKMIETEINEFKKEMLSSRYFDRFLKEQVSDEAINNFYTTNAAQYETKKVNVAHILIRIDKNTTEEERKVKYTRAHEAYSKLKSGVDFATVVTDYSEDTISAKKAGVIGWVNEGAVDPVFSKKVFAELKKDEISEPFLTSFGFHIVKLIEEPSLVKKPLESVKGDIRHQLRKKVKDEEMKRLLKLAPIKVTATK